MSRKISRRELLQGIALAAAGTALAACKTKVVKETVVVEKEKVVEKPVEKVVTQVVEKEKVVTKVVEKVVKPTQPTGPTNALGVTLPPDALPLDQQYRLLSIGKPGEQTGGSYGHEMESLYNRAYPLGFGSEPLTQLDIERRVQGVACESWTVSEDGLAWDFKLRKGLQFSDGKPITAHDWVWTFRRAFGMGYDFSWFFYDILNVKEVVKGELPPEKLGIEALDDYTLRIRTAKYVPYVPALGVWAFVAPKQAYEKYGDDWSVNPKEYIASGPWKLVEFERGVKWTWELNENYKGINRPYFTQLRGRTLPDSLPAYIAGEIQSYTLSIDTPAAEVAMVNANPVLRAESHPQPSMVTWYIGFHTLGKFKPLADRRVRLALSKAIDKAKIIAEVSRGFAYPAWGVVPKGFPGNSYDELAKEDPNVYDVAAAKKLLAEAGYPDGKGFPKYELWIRSPQPYMVTLCEAVQAAWKENLGIEVELYPTDHQTFTSAVFKEKKIPMYFVGYSMDYYDPATFLGVFRSGGRHPHDDSEYDEAFETGNAERDPQKRFEMLAEAEKILVNSVGYIFLIQPFTVRLWPCNLRGEGVQPSSTGFQSDNGYGGGAFAQYGLYWAKSDCRKGL